MLERRKQQRWPAYWAGQISFKRSGSVADCLIRNTSGEGAKLVLSGTIFVPREFDLTIPKHRADYRAKVIWRRSEEVGVAVERIGAADVPMSAGKAVRPRITHQGIDSPAIREAFTPMALLRQLKKLRQQNASLRRRLLMQAD
jgi:PilZ domain